MSHGSNEWRTYIKWHFESNNEDSFGFELTRAFSEGMGMMVCVDGVVFLGVEVGWNPFVCCFAFRHVFAEKAI